MKYTFSLTGGELLEASVRVVLEKYRRNLRVWLTWLFACVLVFWFAGPLVWVILPARVFASEQEKEDFFKLVREDGGVTVVEPEEEKIVPSEEPAFRFVFEMEKDRWLQIYAGALRALQSGAMGMLPRRKSTIGIYLIFLGLAAVFQGLLPQRRILIYVVPVFFLLLVHLLLSGREDPERIVKKLLKAGNMQKNVYGRHRSGTVCARD